MEILLVNDGSSDDSAAVCHDYARHDARIRIFDQENMGPATARNRGLDEANGEYLLFVDADDHVSKDYISSLYNAADSTGADIVFTQIRKIKGGSLIEQTEYAEGTRKNLSERLSLLQEAYYTMLYAKIYKSSLIQGNRLRFLSEKGYFGFAEDLLFALHTAYAADAIMFCSRTAYNYCKDNENSLCLAPEKYTRNAADRMIIIDRILSFVVDKNLTPDETAPVLQMIEKHLYWGGTHALKQFMESLPSNGYPKHIQEHFEQYARHWEKQVSLGWRLKERLTEYARPFPRVYRLLAKLHSYVSASTARTIR